MQRHEALHSNALDLGYTDQAVWNTLHGRPLQFSTLDGAVSDLPLARMRRTDSLLAFHVEPLLVVLAPLSALSPGPEVLLLIQAAAVAAGALPVFLFARLRLRSGVAAAAMARLYLLAPPMEAAVLSDFHTVSLAVPLLLSALLFLETKHDRAFLVAAGLAALAREDAALVVALMGGYAMLFGRRRPLGATVAAMGLGWFALCTLVVMPQLSGLPRSPFSERLDVFGVGMRESLRNLMADPALLLRWLGRPEVVRYLGGLLACGGGLALLRPIELAPAVPVLFANVFSTWSWTYSEGAHYSAIIVPFLIVATIGAVAGLAGLLAARLGVPSGRMAAVLALVALGTAGWHHYQVGVSPPSRNFHAYVVGAHERALPRLLAGIPVGASVSAQTSLYPHVAHRERAYLFPAVNDAEYVLLDVTGSPSPVGVAALHEQVEALLRSGSFGVVAAQDGFLVLEPGAQSGLEGAFRQRFLSFARAEPGAEARTTGVRFGDDLELVGYGRSVLAEVDSGQLPASITTYWRARRQIAGGYRFAWFFTRDDGAIVGSYLDETATSLWYPPSDWRPGEVVRVATPYLPIGRMRDVYLAVVVGSGDPTNAADRIRPAAMDGGAPLETAEGGSLVKLAMP